MSFGGLMQPKWMLKPCANARIMPGRKYGSMSLWYIAACFSSLMRIMIISATLAASAVVITVSPAASAFFQLLLPSYSATTTSQPESRRLSACACPCEP